MSTDRLKVCVAGAGGRMGRAVIAACASDAGVELSGAFERADSPVLGTAAGTLAGVAGCPVPVVGSIDEAVDGAEVVVDFTLPGPSAGHAERCAALGVALVVGTTGFDPAQREAVAAASRAVPVVMAPNMSIGVNLALDLIETAARVLGEEADIEVIEAHHRHKVDAPSGTAVRMGEVIAAARGQRLADCAVYAREGHTGARPPGAIGFATVRAGDIVGEHTVMFAGAGERLEITHRASSRENFAGGALRAAHWLRGRPAGLYDMRDVLGLR